MISAIGTLSLLLLLLPAALAAQPRTLPVTGARQFSDEFIRGLFTSSPPDSALAALQEAYANSGYLGASIAFDSLAGVTIAEGDRYTIERVRLLPDSVAALAEASGITAGEFSGRTFSAADVESITGRLIRALNDRGYPLASAGVAAIQVDDSARAVELDIALESGARVRIGAIDVRGNTSTSRNLILTAAAVEPGAVFTDVLAAQVRSRLQRLNIFSDVGEPQLYRTDSGAYGLLLTVTEGRSNTFDGVIGYQPGTDSLGEGSLTGLVNVFFIFGSGRRISLRWQKQSLTGSQLEFRYGEPFLLGLPLDLDLGYRQNQEETTPALLSYVQRFFTGDLYYGLTDAFSVRLGGAYEATIPQTDTAQPCFRQLLNSRTLETTIGIGYDTRSNPVNPVSGLLYSTSYSLGAKSVLGPSPCTTGIPAEDTRQRAEVDLDGYVTAFTSVVLAGGMHFGEIRGDLLEESDLFRFGGQSTVRGYAENTFRASRRAWGTVELRLLLSSSSYAALFFDGGYYRRPEDPLRGLPALEEWIYGYGVGAQIETAIGLVRLSYALGKPDDFSTGKVFFGLVNQF